MTPKETVNSFSIVTGYYLYLMHTSTDKSKDDNGLSTSGFEIHIHDENDVIKEETVDTDFLYLESAENMRVILSVMTYSQISTERQPCLSDPTYSKTTCQERCLHNYIAREVGCTVPWLRDLEEVYQECSNSSSINDIGNLLSEFMREEILETCSCPIPCNNSVYKYQIESRKDSDAIQAPSSTISVYFPSNLITELTEVVSYDWNIFLSDVGGSLGFLLGLSVIGIVSVVEEVIKLIFRRKKNKEDIVTEEQKLPDLNTMSTSEGQSLKNVMEFMANCDMYQHLQEENTLKKKEVESEKY